LIDMQPHHQPSPDQPPYQPSPNQPQYVPNQPHYLQVANSKVAVSAASRKGRRDIVFGAVWLSAGLLITAITYSSAMPMYFVAWGPALYGIIKIILGLRALSR
jgi:hypothetical protein